LEELDYSLFQESWDVRQTYGGIDLASEAHEGPLPGAVRRRPLYVLLDVTEPEPPLATSPLLHEPNIVLIPHVAGCVGQGIVTLLSFARVGETMADAKPTTALTFPAPVIALAGWVVPGLGYILLRQRARGVTIGLTIFILFALGLLIGGARVVEAPSLAGNASIFSQIMQKPWFIGQVLTGLPGMIAAIWSQHCTTPASTARVNEIGTLYTAVAGMLNLMSVIDSSYRATLAGGES